MKRNFIRHFVKLIFNLTILVFLLTTFSNYLWSEDKTENNGISVDYKQYDIREFGLSLNLAGILAGPFINMDVLLHNNFIVNIHVGFKIFPYLRENYDEMSYSRNTYYSRPAIGGGFIKFFGKRKNKLYLGGIIDYQSFTSVFREKEFNEYSQRYKKYVVAANGGYRIRYRTGLYFNLGAFLGIGYSEFERKFSDDLLEIEITNNKNGKIIDPIFLTELSVGVEL
ncbi:MAG: hypothetical protein OEZ13_05275 [Spirochaetia bacterium]|nr:hypothetical protein [Spirochaetia bacterium]